MLRLLSQRESWTLSLDCDTVALYFLMLLIAASMLSISFQDDIVS